MQVHFLPFTKCVLLAKSVSMCLNFHICKMERIVLTSHCYLEN